VEPSVEVAGRSLGHAGRLPGSRAAPKMTSGHCPWGVGSVLLVAGAGPSRMRHVISLHDFGDLPKASSPSC
jgi:hypothetical protein